MDESENNNGLDWGPQSIWRGNVNQQLRARRLSLFESREFKLFFIQIFMLCIMCAFILSGIILHAIKLRKIQPEDYSEFLDLDGNSQELFNTYLRDIEDNMGQISFFKEITYGDIPMRQENKLVRNIVVCGGTYKKNKLWSNDLIEKAKLLIELSIGNNTLTKFKGGLLFAINDIRNTKYSENVQKVAEYPNIIYSLMDKNEKSGILLYSLFLVSNGYVSPCYMSGKRLYSYILGRRTGILGHIIIILPWIFSLLSPHPFMLVHIPRLLLYIGIAIYRILVLHWGINLIEKKLSNSDFSDHIVLYCMYILIISIEWCAIGCNLQNRLFVACIRGYYLSILAIIIYNSFFTALYFHFPLETLTGFIIALFGLFATFWILVFLNYLNLTNIGICENHNSVRLTYISELKHQTPS
ncbi:hypothetical protein cand_019910 [Cryptosporidium andersoni]|uniref:Uncharacterized protein n=1 Tax=Cryptosporidium andersoni TaxID=117008 RepID=A0A1J4MSQ4_9CRYT|nr:hypothetical protein cand_019910 [Cryptosporidium andersoni]